MNRVLRSFLLVSMAQLRTFLGSLIVLALTGCRIFEPLPLNPSVSQIELFQRSLNDRALHTFLAAHQHPLSGKWDLDRLFLAGYYFSPELDIASSQIAETIGDKRTADALPNPRASLTPGYNQDSAGVTPWSFGYALNLPLELFGQRRLRRSTAAAQVESAHLHFAHTRWTLWNTLRRHLVDLHAAEGTA